MATKIYNKTILQTSFTSLESIYYLLQTVKKNEPISHLQGTDVIFPQARARISQARGGEWDEEKRDTHAELTLKEMLLIRYNEDETFEVSDLGNAFLEAFNLIEEPAENGKFNISLEDNLTLQQRNQFLLDILLRIVVEQPKYNRCIHPYLILFKLLTDTKLYGYISKSEWACFINSSDYIQDSQYIEIRDRLAEVRNNKEQIDAQKSDRILTRLVLWNVLAKIEVKIDGAKQTFFCLNEDFALTLSNYLLLTDTYKTSSIEAKIISQYNPKKSGKNIIYYGTPGSGKSHKVLDIVGDTKYRTIFHPDYDYASFVGSYKPTGDETEGIGYEFIPQVFTNAYVDAWMHPAEEINLVVEEINRGNCAQIFGDLFQLLDRKDGFSEYPVTPNTDLGKHLKKVFKFNPEEEFKGRGYNAELEKKILLGELMILPSNLNIYATMNTSDQSLFPMDSAFKRRWDWEYVPVCYDEKTDEGKDNKASLFNINISEDYNANWLAFLRGVNEKIKDTTYSEDKQMGNYFIKDSIDAATFINKVMYYLWSEVCKEEYKTDKNFFRYENEDGDIIEFSFNELFPINDKAKAILKSFIERMIAVGNK